MIKRRFYRADHGDRDDAPSDSSSSSDSELEAQSSEDSEPQQGANSAAEAPDDDDDDDDVDDDDEIPPIKRHSPSSSSSSSGYESQDSSANEVDAESEGLLTTADDSGATRDGEQLSHSLLSSREENGRVVEIGAGDHPVADDDATRCILKSKSVFKCRLCPKIVCLNEESLKSHLKSKRHARSEKLLKDGRLKRVLDSDGEEVVLAEDDGETHAERHARIVALAQGKPKKGKGRQRQRHRLKRKNQKNSSEAPNSEKQKENCSKRRKNAE